MPVLDGLGPHYLGFYEDKESMNREDFNFGDGSVDLHRTFVGRWEDRLEFIRVAIFLQIDGNPNTGTIITSPARYPGFELARAFRASIDARLPASGKDEDDIILHRIAKIHVYYRVENFGGEDEDDPDENDPDFLYIEESVESHTEIIPISGTHVKIDPDFGYDPGYRGPVPGKYLHEEFKTVNYVQTIFDYKLKIPYVVFPRWLDMANAAGKVNETVFITPSGNLCIPDTLRYDGISAITKRELSGNALVWEMTHNFAFTRWGWNWVPSLDSDDGDIAHGRLHPALFEEYELRKILIPYSGSRMNELKQVYNSWAGNTVNAGQVIFGLKDIRTRAGELDQSSAEDLVERLPSHAFFRTRPIIIPES